MIGVYQSEGYLLNPPDTLELFEDISGVHVIFHREGLEAVSLGLVRFARLHLYSKKRDKKGTLSYNLNLAKL